MSEIELDEFDAVARRLDEAKKMLEESASVKRTVEKVLWQEPESVEEAKQQKLEKAELYAKSLEKYESTL